MSFFHEYVDDHGRKTLRSYSAPFDLRCLDTKLWVKNERACEEAESRLANLRHYVLVNERQARRLSIQA